MLDDHAVTAVLLQTLTDNLTGNAGVSVMIAGQDEPLVVEDAVVTGGVATLTSAVGTVYHIRASAILGVMVSPILREAELDETFRLDDGTGIGGLPSL